MPDVLRQELDRLWLKDVPSPATVAAGLFDELLTRWAAPSRHYHNVEHLYECLQELAAVTDDLGDLDRRTIALALWFHDAIYDPTRSDNEAASADLAGDRLQQLGESQKVIASVRWLILDTAHRAQPATPDGQLIVDIDLAILGKPADRFDRYDAAIRAEYAYVAAPDYRIGRLKVLRGFLDRQAIYHTPRFNALYEDNARANLERAIARLESAEPAGTS